MIFLPLFKNFQNLSDYIQIDLSKETLIQAKIDIQNRSDLDQYIQYQLNQDTTKIAYGGYLEKRELYNNVKRFQTDQNQRNIHLGVDFWTQAGEKIIAPFEGTIHSFANNADHGNYGPTIILKHQDNQEHFFSLYGHLSLKSIQNLQIGQRINKRETFAEVGEAKVNGGYLPHLHFQLIKDMENYKGDYPGVCHENDLNFFKQNTINPNLLLGI